MWLAFTLMHTTAIHCHTWPGPLNMDTLGHLANANALQTGDVVTAALKISTRSRRQQKHPVKEGIYHTQSGASRDGLMHSDQPS
jgi:hypothetical protein